MYFVCEKNGHLLSFGSTYTVRDLIACHQFLWYLYELTFISIVNISPNLVFIHMDVWCLEIIDFMCSYTVKWAETSGTVILHFRDSRQLFSQGCVLLLTLWNIPDVTFNVARQRRIQEWLNHWCSSNRSCFRAVILFILIFLSFSVAEIVFWQVNLYPLMPAKICVRCLQKYHIWAIL